MIVYRANNKETLRANNDKWAKSKKGRETIKRFQEKIKGSEKIRLAKYYQEHKDEFIARASEFSKDNPEKVKSYKTKYSKTERGKDVMYQNVHRRLARKRNALGHFTRKQFRELCAIYSNKCLCCGEKLKLEADHIVPLARGGSDDISNIQPLCRNCNAQKATDSIDYRPKNPMSRMFEGIPLYFNFRSTAMEQRT